MGYNRKSLQKILDYCRQCGDLSLVESVIEAAAQGRTTEMIIETHSDKDAARKQRNLYKALWFYPEQKQFVSMRLNGRTLTITIGKKIERRGRRPL